MKSYNDFISESIVGQVAGFAKRAQKFASKSSLGSSPARRPSLGKTPRKSYSQRTVKKAGKAALDLAGKAAANRHVRTAGSAAKGALQGFKDYGTQGPINKATDAGTGFKPGAGGLGKNIGRGINQNVKTFQKGTKTGALHVPGKQLKGGNYTPAADVDKKVPEKSEGGGVAKSTDGGGVQKGANTFTSRFRKGVTDKIKSKVKKAIGYEGDRDKAAALKKAGRTIQKDVARPKLPAGKDPKTLPSGKDSKPLPSSGGSKPSGGSTPPQRKDLSKTGGGQTIDVKATPVTNTKKPETKPKGSKPSLDDLINDVRGGSSKPKKKSNPDQLNRMAKSQAGSDKTPVIKKAEKGGSLVTSTSKLKAPKETSKPGDSYPSKADRIAAHKKKVANLKSKGVKLREELSFWREEFIWETDKKYPDKVKQIKPMTGTNTIEINPEIETDKYRR